MAPQRPRPSGNQPPRRPKNNSKSNSNANAKGRYSKSGPASSDRKGPGSRRPGGPPATRPAGGSSKPRPSPSPARTGEASSGLERLQKILAHAGVGSRRACEELILQGRVTAGGQVIRELGTKVDPARTPVAVDGQKVQIERPVYFAVYKPKGYVSTNNDPSGRPRVLDILPEIPQRVYTVGRLDEMSVGLIILTNDGELANKLAHPRFGVEKLYRVVVAGSPTREVLNQLVEGIWLAEGKVRAKSVRAVGKRGESTILELVLAEGKNREVRRMLAKLGHKVMTLTRVAVGPITIKGLTAGQYRPLTSREVDLLRRVAEGKPVPMPWMSDRKPRREPERPRGPRSQANPPSGPPRHTEGPRLGAGHGGPSRHPTAPGMPSHPGVPPSERPAPGRRPAGPPSGHAPGRRNLEERPPRPPGRPGGYGQDRRDRDQGPPQPPGPRHFRDNGPRPSNGHGEERRPRPGGPGQERRGPAQGPPRLPGPRAYREDAPRASNRPAEGRRPGPRPNGHEGPAGGRRPGPPPSGQEPARRRVIGMELPQPTPRPEPSEASSGGDDRPKSRLKRPTGKRPAPRPLGGSRPKPKPRKSGRRGED